MDDGKIKLFGLNEKHTVWRKEIQRLPSTRSEGVVASWLRPDLLHLAQESLPSVTEKYILNNKEKSRHQAIN